MYSDRSRRKTLCKYYLSCVGKRPTVKVDYTVSYFPRFLMYMKGKNRTIFRPPCLLLPKTPTLKMYFSSLPTIQGSDYKFRF